MSRQETLKMVGDFETTVYDGQTSTEVWASALVPLGSEEVQIFHSIEETWEYIKTLKRSVTIYYHNLKFDGAFWIDFLMRNKKLKPGYVGTLTEGFFKKASTMPSGEFVYAVSDDGSWYSIQIKYRSYLITIQDSLKLIPLSVKAMGKAFGTKHRKLEMEYEGYRYAGCEITDEEKQYIANDVLVVKESLEYMFAQGHDKMTIGSCCLGEFKKLYGKYEYETDFPRLDKIKTDYFPLEDSDDFIRRSYRGGWCYVNPNFQNKLLDSGCTADVNSLYPSVMHSESGNAYPCGKPVFWYGEIPEEAKLPGRYYFVRIKTRFKIKEGHLPFIQIKGKAFYKGTECLTTSDIYDPKTGKYYDHYRDEHGKKQLAQVVLTLTMTDYELMLEHYDIFDTEFLGGCWFWSKIGMFDDYINKYRTMKVEAKDPGERQIAKLFLNNLYGKFATSRDSSFKVAYISDDGEIKFSSVKEEKKDPVYIAVGSAVTSYARAFTIRAAQANYSSFCYADTDSIHCCCKLDEVKGITVHPKNFCCWKLESTWDKGFFVRQKTYIEHVVEEDREPVKPWYNVKCAGMPENCKNLFLATFKDVEMIIDVSKLSQEEKDFLQEEHSITDLKIGLEIPGKLVPRRIPGGVLLVKTIYTLRDSLYTF